MPRLKVLSALDTARTQYYHFKAIIITGMGMFTDSYDLFCIPPITKLLGRLYYEPTEKRDEPGVMIPGVMPPEVVSATIAIALLGTAVGQIIFGWLGDRMGRRRVYGLSLVLMVFASIGCGFSICRTPKCVLTSISFFRFWLGVGIGGDYPLSATIMSEFANKRTRGGFIAAVFSMQGFGILASSAVTMIVCTAFRHASKPTISKLRAPDEADLAWRLILMFGAIPAMLTYYWRMMMPETPRYTALVENNISQAVRDMELVLDELIEEDFNTTLYPSSYDLFSKQFFHRHGRDLFATAAAWFLVDIIFYTNNLFQSLIYQKHFNDPQKVDAYQEAFHVAALQAIIAIASTIPGHWAAVFFIDRVGRVKIQMMGFLIMSICLFIIGGPYFHHWYNNPTVLFYFLYGLTFFFSNFGPNTTTFVVPAELFSARFRSTCHGIAGAIGKLGAIIGSVGFLWASPSTHKKEVEPGYHPGIGMKASLLILGGIGVLGFILTFLFTPETKGISLENNETQAVANEMQSIRSPSRTDLLPLVL